MKTFFKLLLKYYLKIITKLTLLVHQPVIIAVAGSINKPFVKQEIKRTLQAQGKTVRTDPKNFNTDIGLPLAVLNLPSGYNSYRNWLPVIRRAPLAIFKKGFPEYLVIGLGSSDPGDIKYLMSLIKPRVVVVTDITQRYLEGFSDMDELVQEYTYLAKNMDQDNLMVLNYDNSRVREIAKMTNAQISSFGLNEPAEWRAGEIAKTKDGQTVNIHHNNKTTQHSIRGFGKHNIYALLIGLIIGEYAQKKEK